ncbi:MAG: c-type cytochrome [Bacteroidota bacterium]
MDFPIFHLDIIGDRLLVAVIAITHVLINHSLAVGFFPIVTLLEFRGYKAKMAGLPESEQWDSLAYKLMYFAFIITTTVGALTGVGIWFSAALVSPASIASLIRVFFSAWFVEWIVFISEVGAIMIYFLTWKRSNSSIEAKKRHIRFGLALSILSWITMAIIVGILGFMMDTGSWVEKKSLLTGFTNPMYIPQMLFRTPMAFVMAGSVAFFLTLYHLRTPSEFRTKVLKNIAGWMFIWTPHVLASGIIYYYKVPEMMKLNLSVAVGTQVFQNWYDTLLYSLGATIVVSMLFTLWVSFKPKRIPLIFAALPVIVTFFTLGTFERIREFIRKPFVIGNYMYSNQLRMDEYELFQKEGILKYATYVDTPEITEENKLRAGRNVFNIACSRCHTSNGVNSVVNKFIALSPAQSSPLEKQQLLTYIPVMHKARYFMPPFPGNAKELDALAEYILFLQQDGNSHPGAQAVGVNISPLHSIHK